MGSQRGPEAGQVPVTSRQPSRAEHQAPPTGKPESRREEEEQGAESRGGDHLEISKYTCTASAHRQRGSDGSKGSEGSALIGGSVKLSNF